VAHAARVCNYWLGGKDHFAADREAGREVMRLRPEVVAGVRANREFLVRVVRYLVSRGVRQFLDVGCGLPAADNTHEIAQRLEPYCRVVYVDTDPMVLAHAEALLASTWEGFCDYLEADLHDVDFIMKEASRSLDLARPVGLLLLAVLHLVPGDAAGAVAALAGSLAPGSFVAVSHLTADFAPRAVIAAVEAYNELAPVPVTARGHAEVTALFGGHPLVAPGIVPVFGWRPDRPGFADQAADLYGGMARTARPPWQPRWHGGAG